MFDDIIGEEEKKPKKNKKKKPRSRLNLMPKGQTVNSHNRKTRKQIELMKKAMKIRKDLDDAYNEDENDEDVDANPI